MHCTQHNINALQRNALLYTKKQALQRTAMPCTGKKPLLLNSMHCTALHWIAMHSTAQRRWRCNALQCPALDKKPLPLKSMHCTALQCIAMHRTTQRRWHAYTTTLHYSAPPAPLHCTVLHSRYAYATPRSMSSRYMCYALRHCTSKGTSTHCTSKGANTFHFYSKVVHWKSSNIPLRCPRYKFIFALYPTLTFPPVTRTEYFPDAKNKGKKEKNEHRCSLDLFLVIYIHWNVKNNRVSRCSLQFISEIWYCRSFGL